MSERLKQIWGGFAEVTTRRLTGRGVENIVVQHREDRRDAERKFLPDGFDSPAEAAFRALRAQLSAQEKRAAKRRLRRGETQELSAPPPPLSAAASDEGAPAAARDLIRGLKATEARTARSEASYTARMKPADGAGLRRRKIFGLF
jgi:hypothetical protein